MCHALALCQNRADLLFAAPPHRGLEADVTALDVVCSALLGWGEGRIGAHRLNEQGGDSNGFGISRIIMQSKNNYLLRLMREDVESQR